MVGENPEHLFSIHTAQAVQMVDRIGQRARLDYETCGQCNILIAVMVNRKIWPKCQEINIKRLIR